MDDKGFIEKRKYARLDIRSKVSFSIIETNKDGKELITDRFRAIGKNIGVEGILFICDKELTPGTTLDLEIFFPKRKDPVYIKGEVRRCGPVKDGEQEAGQFDVGLKFLTVEESHVLMLIEYVCGKLGTDEHHLVL